MTTKMNIEKAALLLSIALFLISLTQKCFCTDGGGCGDSIAVLITGSFGFLLGGAALTWLANPLLLGFHGSSLLKIKSLHCI
ncbi:MAG: hypothetical protein QM734_15225 [Cyclobacteriaceae bacterium]